MVMIDQIREYKSICDEIKKIKAQMILGVKVRTLTQ